MRLCKIDSVLLGMFSLVLIMLGSPASAQITMDDAKVIAAYPLTVEKMEKKYEATIEIARLAGSDPDFARQMDSGAGQTTLDGKIKAFNAGPKAVSIVQAHGLCGSRLFADHAGNQYRDAAAGSRGSALGEVETSRGPGPSRCFSRACPVRTDASGRNSQVDGRNLGRAQGRATVAEVKLLSILSRSMRFEHGNVQPPQM